MIEITQSSKSIREILENHEVETVVQSCNCFHDMNGQVADILKELTNNDIFLVDKNFSLFGDINKLGEWTSDTYTLFDKEVEIFNLYTHYLPPVENTETVHWASVHDGIYEIIDQSESSDILAIENPGYDASTQAEFVTLLSGISKKYENDLPDVNIIVFQH